MKRLSISLAIAAITVLTVVATVSAAGPMTRARDQVQSQTTLSTILGLTSAEVMELRHDGLSLAQIAERQNVDPQKLIDALVAQWSGRIDARVSYGALTTDEAAKLKEQLGLQAKAMVNQTTLGGMHGAAVGAGPGAPGNGNGYGGGMGAGRGGHGHGICDGSGPGASS
jgi:hypothetical protein